MADVFGRATSVRVSDMSGRDEFVTIHVIRARR